MDPNVPNDQSYIVHFPLAEEYRCSICYPLQKTYKRHSDLSKHTRRYHLKTLKFVCRTCDTLFDTIKKCKAHQKANERCDENVVTPYSPAGLKSPPIPATGALKVMKVKRCRPRPASRFEEDESDTDVSQTPPRRILRRRRPPSSSSSATDGEVFAPNAPVRPVHAPAVRQAEPHFPAPDGRQEARHASPVITPIFDDAVNAAPDTNINVSTTSLSDHLSAYENDDRPAEDDATINAEPPTPHETALHRLPPEPPTQNRAKRITKFQREWCEKIEATDTPRDLDDVLDRLVTAIRPAATATGGNAPARPQRRPNNNNRRRGPRDDVHAATRIQRLYRNNRRRAYIEITGSESPHCSIDKNILQAHFTRVHGASERTESPLPPEVPSQAAVPPDDANPLAPAITPEEVTGRLIRCSNNAPGPDGVQYRDWRKRDPGAHVLATVFGKVRHFHTIPKAWLKSTTILLHKKGDKADPNNWRPISLANTIAKIYASVLANRISSWAVEHGRISPGQKGFMPVDGCSEHNFVLQSVITEARRHRRRASIAFLDLTNAFGSIPHSTIFQSLEYAGLNGDAIEEIRLLYQGCTTAIRANDGLTEEIPILSGVKQGCPLSPIVFNLALEPMLRAIAKLNRGFDTGVSTVDALAYADDIALVSTSTDGLTQMLETTSSIADWAGLQFNARKCASLDIDGAARLAHAHEFRIQNKRMDTMAADDFYQHLGVPTGYLTVHSATEAIEKVRMHVRMLDNSLLAPWQKIDALNTFILPTLQFHLHNGIVPKAPLSSLDKMIKQTSKKWLNLPQRASAEVLYIPYKQGGAGILPLNVLADIGQIVHGYRILTARNSVNQLSNHLLRDVVSKRLRRRLTPGDVAAFLNGSMEGDFARGSSEISNVWAKLRIATVHLTKSLDVKWVENVDGGVELTLNGSKISAVKTEHLLRAGMAEFYRQRLLCKPDQGKVYSVTSATPASNHFLNNGSFTRFADWRFIHRARLGVVPLNGANRFDRTADKRCRRCGYHNETLPHVLNHCPNHLQTITKRHDAILNRLVKALRPSEHQEVRVNRRLPGADNEQRPDLVIINETDKNIRIVDVSTAFENRYAAFQAARAEKHAKYEGLATSYKQRGYQVTVDAFVVGALGGWDVGNELVLRKLNISQKYCQLMRKLMASDCIKWSRDIYVEHTTGQRQY